MQPNTISIIFSNATKESMIHQIRNFAEALFLELRGTRLGTVRNMDSATDVCPAP
jgi:hypothetical protein